MTTHEKSINKEILYNKKIYLYYISLTLVMIAIYFFYINFKSNYEVFRDFKFRINILYVILSYIVTTISFLIDTFIFYRCINKLAEGKRISFIEAVAVLNTSSFFKYVPGVVWGYMAQTLWFSEKGISKSKVLYANFVCSISVVIVSVLLGISCLAHDFLVMGIKNKIVLLTFFILDLLFIVFNSTIIGFYIRIANSYLNRKIQKFHMPKSLLLGIQLLYLIQWNFLGVGGYFLAKGIGLEVLFTNFYAILASISLSWVIGYISIVTPGGIGVREGSMYFILKHMANVQIALIMPIATRFLYLLVELSLFLLGLLMALRCRIHGNSIHKSTKMYVHSRCK